MDNEFKTFLKYGFAVIGLFIVFCALLGGLAMFMEHVSPRTHCVTSKWTPQHKL